MFKNPFSKKNNDDGFQLDNYKIPSLADTNNKSSNNSFSDKINENNNFDMAPPPEQPIPSYTNDTNLNGKDSYLSKQSSFETMSQNLNSSSNNINKSGNDDIDLIKARIEGIEAKFVLMDAKISNVSQKLDIIYKILLEEVSEETKKKMAYNEISKTTNKKLSNN